MKKNSDLILHHILWRGLYFFSILILNILIARFFAAEKSGQVFFIVNNLSFILLLVSLSLESGTGYYLAAGNLNSSAMARLCLIWATIAGIIAAFSWWTILYLSRSVYLKQSGLLTVSFLFILGVLYTTYFTALFYAKKEFALPNKILFLVNILMIATLIIGNYYAAVRQNFLVIYFSGFFVQGVLLTISFFNLDLPTSHSGPISVQKIKNVFHYSLVALVANVIYFLVNRIDYWFVKFYCTSKDLGNYIQASKLGQFLLILPGILAATLFPIFSSGKKSDQTKEITAVIRVLFWINTLLCVLILSAGWFLFPFIFGNSFDEMYWLFAFLIPGILAFTMNYTLAAWFSASRQIRVNIIGGLIALIIIIAGDVFILPIQGIKSAALISSTGYLSHFIYSLTIYRKGFNFPFKDLLLIRKSDILLLRNNTGTKISNAGDQNNIIVQNPGI